jgi:hypothetical protein
VTPRKLSLQIATFSYGGNGGFKSEHPDVGRYLAKLSRLVAKDDRIGDVFDMDYADTPITMTRNLACVDAIQKNADLLLMIDSDMSPDYEVMAGAPYAKPFFESGFDHIYKNWDKGPLIIGAPYCGPPPDECVYVFEWTNAMSRANRPQDMRLKMFERNAAAVRGGFEQVGALATGLILIDVRLLKMTDPRRAVQKYVEQGDSKATAESKTKGWFYYEYSDATQSQKGSTEDVTFTRDMSMYGKKYLGYNPIVVNWDAWAIHHKPYLVCKPWVLGADEVGDRMWNFVEIAKPSNARQTQVDFTENLGDSGPAADAGGDPDPGKPGDDPEMGGNAPVGRGWNPPGIGGGAAVDDPGGY